MARNILGFVVGFLVAGTLIGGIQRIGHHVYPPPPEMNPNDPESIQSYMNQAPTGALLFVLMAWVLGTLAGTYAATRIAQTAPRGAAIAVGTMMLGMSVAMMLSIPVPSWFWACALLGVTLATAVPIMATMSKQTSQSLNSQRDRVAHNPQGSAGSGKDSG